VTTGRRRLAALAIFLGVTLLYYASNPRLPDAYKHHVYVADAWLHGRLWVSGYPAHYHDWITVNGQMHSPFAPTPAILLLPFVWWWGTAFNMNAFSMALSGLNAALCWLLLLRVCGSPRRAALGTLIYAFGTVNWYGAIIGTTWFLAQICAQFFLLLGLLELTGRARGVLVGASVGFAVLSRANVVAALPALVLLLIDRHAVRVGLRRFLDRAAVRHAFLFAMGLALPLGIEMALNYARFGNPLDTGYDTASKIYTDRLTYGHMYDLRYIPKHLYVALFSGWEYVNEWPFVKPSPEGLAVVFTSPILAYALAAPWRDRTVRLLWLATALTAVLIVPYFTQGWVQFGYRYLLDALPYMIVLTALGMANKSRRAITALLVFSVLSNWLGVYWGKKLGW
jgi:hypothetical protein